MALFPSLISMIRSMSFKLFDVCESIISISVTLFSTKAYLVILKERFVMNFSSRRVCIA